MTNIFPFLYNTALNQTSLNNGAGDIKHYPPYPNPTPTPYPVPAPTPYPGGPFFPSGSGVFGTDNTLTTILYIGAALTLFSLLFFSRKTA